MTRTHGILLLLLAAAGLFAACIIAGCAPGADGLRQACTNTDAIIAGGYQVTTAWYKDDQNRLLDDIADQPMIERAKAIAIAREHTAVFAKTLAGIDAAVALKRAVCDSIDAVATGDIPSLIARLSGIAADIRKFTTQALGVK